MVYREQKIEQTTFPFKHGRDEDEIKPCVLCKTLPDCLIAGAFRKSCRLRLAIFLFDPPQSGQVCVLNGEKGQKSPQLVTYIPENKRIRQLKPSCPILLFPDIIFEAVSGGHHIYLISLISPRLSASAYMYLICMVSFRNCMSKCFLFLFLIY